MVVVELEPGSPEPQPVEPVTSFLVPFGSWERRGGGSRVLKGPPLLPTHPLSPHIPSPSPVPSPSSGILLGQSRALLSRLNLQKVFAQTYWDTWAQPIQPKAEMGLISEWGGALPLPGPLVPPPPLVWLCHLLKGPHSGRYMYFHRDSGSPAASYNPQRNISTGAIYRGGPRII